MVATDDGEWGLELSGTLVKTEEGPGEDGQGTEGDHSLSSEGSVYEKWEDSCLVKFSEFLGFSIVGFEKEIMELFRKMVSMQNQDKRK